MRQAGVAARQDHLLDGADAPLVDCALQSREMGIEAPVETDHQRRRGFIDDRKALPDALERQVDRLFAEDRLAGPREALDEIGMGIGRGADRDGINVGCGQDLVDRRDPRAMGLGKGVRGGIEGVRHGDEPRARRRGDRVGVNLADATGAQNREGKRHDGISHWTVNDGGQLSRPSG